MGRFYFTVLLLVYLAFAAKAQPEVVLSPAHSGGDNSLQIGQPVAGESVSDSGLKILWTAPAMEEATSAPKPIVLEAATTTTTVPSISLTTSIAATTTILASTTSTTTTTVKTGTPPVFEWIKIENRDYQNKQIVSATPKISAGLKSESGLDAGKISIIINKGTGAAKSFQIKEADVSARSLENDPVKTLAFSYDLPDPGRLKPGSNTIEIFAGNAFGSTSETMVVEVFSGPLSVTDIPVHFPSPFSPSRNRAEGLKIQYTLSENADIDIYLFNIAGEQIKKISCSAGSEGGRAGLNQVKWDGLMDPGGMIGNGIYAGTIIAKKDGKRLKKFKLNVFD